MPRLRLFDRLPIAVCAGLLAACAGYSNLDPRKTEDAAVLEKACNAGSGEACTFLGHRYYWESSYHDMPRAVALYERACQLGDEHGCANGGLILRDGADGISPDPVRRDALFQRACDLGTCYYRDQLRAKNLAASGNASSAAEQPEEKKTGGGFLRGAMAAAGGFAAAKSVGATDGQALDAAMKAADALSTDDPTAAKALIAQGSNNSASNASTGSKATGGPAYSGPTQPNKAAQFCKGFTMENYRQKALEKTDVQLNVQCGLAFEYYKAYLNTIKQGYAASDVQNTYNAHLGASKVVEQVYRMR